MLHSTVIKVDTIFSLSNILFESNSHLLKESSFPTLDTLGQILQNNSDLQLTIFGHTDNVGSAESNQLLSEQRVQAVANYLASKNSIDVNRINSIGKGEESPIDSNDTEEGRARNRRVEFLLQSKVASNKR